jgi:eukaryotic translation initiation factor 2C
MVVQRIKDWITEQSTVNNAIRLPKNILYYRDGVSEPQYMDVRHQELPHIRSAWTRALDDVMKLQKYAELRDRNVEAPKLTAIVCAKRHHVRFYPATTSAKDMDKNNKNCHSGTYVDDVVTSPYYVDFYLQSHSPLQGTARPAHYFIIVNEMDNTVDELRQLVRISPHFKHPQLTHTDPRTLLHLCPRYLWRILRQPSKSHTLTCAQTSTDSVLPSPQAYYADRLCERGRHYLRDFFVNTPNGQQRRNQIRLHKNQQDVLLATARTNRFGPRFLANGNKRPKAHGEEMQEQADNDTVDRLVRNRVQGMAETEFYRNGPGRNPWHDNIAKTMFWM